MEGGFKEQRPNGEEAFVVVSLKRYTDTERTSPMKRTQNTNGNGRDTEVKPLRYIDLQAYQEGTLLRWADRFIRQWGLNPVELYDAEIKAAKKDFLYQHPDLAKMIPNKTVMGRLLYAALKKRREEEKKQQERRALTRKKRPHKPLGLPA